MANLPPPAKEEDQRMDASTKSTVSEEDESVPPAEGAENENASGKLAGEEKKTEGGKGEDGETSQMMIESKSSSGSKDAYLNPQDDTLDASPPVAADFPVTVHDDNSSKEDSAPIPAASSNESSSSDLSPQKLPGLKEASKKSQRRKRNQKRLRGVRSRVAPIDDNHQSHVKDTKGLPTPSNQYECVLRRRAVKPLDPNLSESELAEQPPDTYGDISLGMKLSVSESGEVIVQHVTPLADGRASPAQLTGLIKRGDILMAIDGVSLTENALSGLNALKAPEDKKIPCQRTYKLRLAAGEGLEMLRKIEEQRERANRIINAGPRDPASEMLALFPMVDQLSGAPLFDEAQNEQAIQEEKTDSPSSDDSPVATTEETTSSSSKKQLDQSLKRAAVFSINEQISESLATLRVEERNRYLLKRYTECIRNALGLNGNDDDGGGGLLVGVEELLTLPQRQELGRRAIVGARNLLKQVENIDAGKDLRSFQNWNTTLSQYSRASARRRRVFDAASLPLNFGKFNEEDEEDDDSDGGSSEGGQSSTNSEQVDGDELLLRLAAHDVIWRKQVIEFLDKVAQCEDSGGDQKEEKTAESSDINTALSHELGNFLFGENMSKVLAKHKTPRSLPSEEVTAVLFDLATELSASVPDAIQAAQSTMSSRSGLAPLAGLKRHAADSDVLLATRFLLDEALPAWLKSFRPLAWEHRRILWPVSRIRSGGSTAASTMSDDDSITLGSVSVSMRSHNSPSQSRARKRVKNIQEIIEDQELNIETRGEACFLVTYYFIHAMLPRLMRAEKTDDGPQKEKGKDDIVVFMGEYGSYLKMDTCLAYAAALKADSVVDILLSIAKHDPRHREVIKQTTKSTTMVFYEPSMLSAVLQLLYGIQKETSRERKRAIIDLCAAAYPDVRPWQAKKSCHASQPPALRDEMSNWYYTYLSLLLHPTDGHDTARRDPPLVKEWCEISVKDLVVAADETGAKKDRRTNFFFVASRASSHHLAYHRDLLLLLTLSMEIKEHSLALDLAGEIIEDPKLSMQDSSLDLVLKQVRLIGLYSLDAEDDESKQIASKMLKRILRLYEKSTFRRVVDVPGELLRFLEHRAGKDSIDIAELEVLELIQFLGEEAIPVDVLQTLNMIETLASFQPDVFPVLHTLLARGASSGNDLSASLLRIKQSRRRRNGGPLSATPSLGPSGGEYFDGDHYSSSAGGQSIWKNMSSGMVAIEK